jgi:hypothetical protein
MSVHAHTPSEQPTPPAVAARIHPDDDQDILIVEPDPEVPAVRRVALLAPDALAELLAAAEQALLILSGLARNRVVSPVFNRLFAALAKARGE